MTKNAKHKSWLKTDNQNFQCNSNFEHQNFTRMPFFRKAAWTSNKIKMISFVVSFYLWVIQLIQIMSDLVVSKTSFINIKKFVIDHQDKEVEKVFDFIFLELVE